MFESPASRQKGFKSCNPNPTSNERGFDDGVFRLTFWREIFEEQLSRLFKGEKKFKNDVRSCNYREIDSESDLCEPIFALLFEARSITLSSEKMLPKAMLMILQTQGSFDKGLCDCPQMSQAELFVTCFKGMSTSCG
jgi:hypothetical protein